VHTPDHELWYASLALGEGDLPAGAREELARCEVCAGKQLELDAVRTELEQSATEQREVLAAAGGFENAPGSKEAEQRLRSLIAASPARPARSRRAVLWAVAALVAVLLGGALFRLIRSGASHATPEVLSGGGFTGLAPSGAWARGTPLSWGYALPADGWFIVRLRDRESSSAFAESPHLTSPQWKPSDDERAQWPREFDWQVAAYDPSGRPLGISPRVAVSQR
jgi:hypothetical protein